nr:reverse transcriptase domain, reverse transcriptase zinc-binding domain protein [Tanacetum cinerariifolium]
KYLMRKLRYDVDIGDDRASGPDGYMSAFFNKGWDIVGMDVCSVIIDLFSNGQILKEINHTFIALIPKVSTPLKVNDYRPISFCNVIFTCISKILTNRIIDGIKEVVSQNQSAFVLGRRISDNILIIQELMLNYHRDRGPPRYHKHCKDLNIINVCSADDLFIFPCGDVDSTQVIIDSLDEFKRVLGLVPSIPKTTTFFCNVLNHVKVDILNIMSFAEGKLPVKYLGVPLISSRLLNRDCKILVEKRRIILKIGKINLFRLLVDSNYVNIQQLIRGFMWCNGEYKRGRDKVAWNDICLPKHEGGLVSDMEANGAWLWPHAWLQKAPILGNILASNLDNYRNNHFQLRDVNRKLKVFSVRNTWEAIRQRGTLVNWFKVVWFAHNIPRHVFHLWLVMRRSLKTQDRMRQWYLGTNVVLNMLRCPLCESQKDTYEHLFFKYSFSALVWNSVRHLAGMDHIQEKLNDVVLFLKPIENKRTENIIGRLILVATSYFIWLEQNNHTFKKAKKNLKQIKDIIMVTVSQKLLMSHPDNGGNLGMQHNDES